MPGHSVTLSVVLFFSFLCYASLFNGVQVDSQAGDLISGMDARRCTWEDIVLTVRIPF